MGIALLDMFAKCGNEKLARQIFKEMGTKRVSCWNSMIVALAVHGYSDEALEFSKMDQKPKRVFFSFPWGLVSHKGLVEEGTEFLRRMLEEYKIKPYIKHYGYMVDMLSRMGLVDEAYKMIKSMQMTANSGYGRHCLGAVRFMGVSSWRGSVSRAFVQLGL